jgi:hypothetical protein
MNFFPFYLLVEYSFEPIVVLAQTAVSAPGPRTQVDKIFVFVPNAHTVVSVDKTNSVSTSFLAFQCNIFLVILPST